METPPNEQQQNHNPNDNSNNSGGSGGGANVAKRPDNIDGLNFNTKAQALLDRWEGILARTQNLPSLTEQLLLGPTETEHLSTPMDFNFADINKSLPDGEKLNENEMALINEELKALSKGKGQPGMEAFAWPSNQVPLWAVEALGAQLLDKGRIKESNFLLKAYEKNMQDKANKNKTFAYILSFLSYGMMIAGFVSYFVAGGWTIALALIGIGFGVKQIIGIFQKLHDRSKTKNEKKAANDIKGLINTIRQKKISTKNQLEKECREQIKSAQLLKEQNDKLKKEAKENLDEKDKEIKELQNEKKNKEGELKKKEEELANKDKELEEEKKYRNQAVENNNKTQKEMLEQIKETKQENENNKEAFVDIYNEDVKNIKEKIKQQLKPLKKFVVDELKPFNDNKIDNDVYKDSREEHKKFHNNIREKQENNGVIDQFSKFYDKQKEEIKNKDFKIMSKEQLDKKLQEKLQANQH